MASQACFANYFDASALVKLYVEEDGADIVRKYFQSQATKHTTPFCLYEALNVLKVKWLYRKQISKSQYLDAAHRLVAWYQASSTSIKDIDFTSRECFAEAKRLTEVSNLGIDLSDAFQILSIRAGYYSHNTGGSQTILVTADNNLATVAKNEGLRVWNFINEPAPL